MPVIFLLFGIGFGFLLSRAGATEFDYYTGLFLFTDLQLFWVIAAAVLVGVVGIVLMKRSQLRGLVDRQLLDFKGRPFRSSLIPGSLLFGAGWGLAGACPGSVLAMLGEGRLAAIPTLGGIVIGTWLYGLLENRAAARAATG